MQMARIVEASSSKITRYRPIRSRKPSLPDKRFTSPSPDIAYRISPVITNSRASYARASKSLAAACVRTMVFIAIISRITCRGSSDNIVTGSGIRRRVRHCGFRRRPVKSLRRDLFLQIFQTIAKRMLLKNRIHASLGSCRPFLRGAAPLTNSAAKPEPAPKRAKQAHSRRQRLPQL